MMNHVRELSVVSNLSMSRCPSFLPLPPVFFCAEKRVCATPLRLSVVGLEFSSSFLVIIYPVVSIYTSLFSFSMLVYPFYRSLSTRHDLTYTIF